MQHLDDGVLHALVDGEVGSADLAPIQAHLAACADCAARLESARLLAGEADQLVDAIEFPDPDRAPAVVSVRPVGGGRLGRRLAWAASVALAAGLGYAGGRRGPHESTAPTDVAMAPATALAPAAEAASPDQPQVQAVPAPSIPPQTATRSRATLAGESREVPAAAGAEPTPKAELATAENETPVTRDLAAPGAAGGVNAPVAAGRAAADEKAAESKMALRREAAPAARQMALEYSEVTLEEAVRRLGGPLRQIEGLVPVRLEAAGLTVRVVYTLSAGDVVLEQRRLGDSVAVRLLAPGLSPDSLARLRVRQ